MVDGFSCILDFPGLPRTPLIEEIYQLNPQNIPSTTTTAKGKKKKPESPPPLKQPTRKLSLVYIEIEKRRRALGQDLFYVICNWAV